MPDLEAAAELPAGRGRALAQVLRAEGFVEWSVALQMRRAAVSIPANIAEGFRRRGRADKARYMNRAEGSREESRYYLILAHDLGYGDTEHLMSIVDEVSRLLNAYTAAILAYPSASAVSNNRLLDLADGKVTFRYKDYRHDDQQKTMTLEAAEFIRRFLLHVLPDGFQRIRYYGFLGNRYREQKLAHCRFHNCRRMAIHCVLIRVETHPQAWSCLH